MTDVKTMNPKQERNNVKNEVNAPNIVKTIDSTCRNTKTVINTRHQRNISLERNALKTRSKSGYIEQVGDGNIIRCFDDQTEILAEDGWKFFSNLTVKDKVATLTDQDSLEYCFPDTVINEPYEGKMLLIETKEISQLITPNHNTWVALRRGRKEEWVYGFHTAEQIQNKRVKMKKNATIWKGEDQEDFEIQGVPEAHNPIERLAVTVDMKTWVEFLGYFLPEGSTFIRGYYYSSRIAQSKTANPTKHATIERCLSKMPFKFVPDEDGFHCTSVRLAKYLKRFGRSADRYIPKEIKQLPPELLRQLFDALIVGDGNIVKGKPTAYFTVSKKLADDVQEILLKMGLAGNVSVICEAGKVNGKIKGKPVTTTKRLYGVYILHEKYHEPMVNHSHSKHSHSKNKQGRYTNPYSWIQYKGQVGCCVVTNHRVYVRRKGKPVWSGNSFDKTPTMRKNTDVYCPHFSQLAWSHGCPFHCLWCYLQGTYRWESYKTKDHSVPPKWKNREEIEKAVTAFLVAPNLKPHLLNSGELSDSLWTERSSRPFSELIMSYFKGTKHKVLFLSKMTDVQHFLENKWQKNAILSWSINAVAVANRYEKRAPDPMERIKAAKLVSDAGYTVRVRLDPMVPVEDWPRHYGDIIGSVCENFKPERVTLGTLRGLASTIAASKDREWVKYLTESSNWGRKPSLETRLAMYSFAIESFRKRGIRKIAVCKDTKQIWNVLKTKYGLDYHKMMCNCLP